MSADEQDYEVLLEPEEPIRIYVKVKAKSPHEAARLAKEQHAGKRQTEVELGACYVGFDDDDSELTMIVGFCERCGKAVLGETLDRPGDAHAYVVCVGDEIKGRGDYPDVEDFVCGACAEKAGIKYE